MPIRLGRAARMSAVLLALSAPMAGLLAAPAAQLPAAPGSAAKPPATARPYAMRGVELGITLDEFRRIPVINDTPERLSEPQVRCSNESMSGVLWSRKPAEDIALGVLSCGWFTRFRKDYGELLLDHHIDLAAGKGPPVFQFVEQNGTSRLFRIRFFAHTSFGEGIVDALSRNFGAPVQTTEPFQVMTGPVYTATTSVWDNGVSTITFTTPCQQLNRYCLSYEHGELKKLYDALVDRRSAAAASKI